MKVKLASMFKASEGKWQVEASDLGWGAGYFPPTFEVEHSLGFTTRVYKRTRVLASDATFMGYQYESVRGNVKVLVVND